MASILTQVEPLSFREIVIGDHYCSKRSNGRPGVEHVILQLGSFAQLRAPEDLRRPREVSVAEYTSRGCMQIRGNSQTGV